MKNIHVLPTDKPSRLIRLSNGELRYNENSGLHSFYPQNIYITSDEEIKEGDWVVDIFKNACPVIRQLTTEEEVLGVQKTELKIILTTDQELIADGVQSIDDNFLEFFVKNPNCESVEIRKIEDELISPKNPKIRFNALQDPPSFISAESLNNMILTYKYEIIIPKETFKQKTKDRIMSETSEETKQKARDYGNSLIKQDRTCTHNCSAVCGECQILEPKPLLSVEWLLRYIEDLNNKGYTFIPSSNKEIVEHIKQMEKDNMIAFLKFVFQQDGFDYEQAYNNFLKQQIL